MYLGRGFGSARFLGDVMEEVKKEIRSLNPSRHKLTEHVNQVHSITVEIGTTLEHVQNPAFLAHIAPIITQYDRILVKPDDGAWYADLLVVECANNWVKTQVFAFLQIDKEFVNTPDAFETHRVEFAGAHHKWRVVRNSDNEVVKSGMSKGEAHLWRDEYVKTIK
jgi:hypothetical protein